MYRKVENLYTCVLEVHLNRGSRVISKKKQKENFVFGKTKEKVDDKHSVKSTPFNRTNQNWFH